MDEKGEEIQDKNVFNFKEWLNQCHLTSVGDIFQHLNMTSIKSLSMENENLSKLLSDKRICSNPKLLGVIIESLQKLENEKDKYSNTKSKAKKLSKIQSKLDKINDLEQKMTNLRIEYIKQSEVQQKYLKSSKIKYVKDANKCRQQITDTFSSIYDAIKNKEFVLLNELETYNLSLDKMIDTESNDNDDDEKMDSNESVFETIYAANERIIKDYKTYIIEQLNLCKHTNDKNTNQIMQNIENRSLNELESINQNMQSLKDQIRGIEESKFEIKSIAFRLNEKIYTNLMKEMNEIGQMLKYKKIEIEIQNVEWTQMNQLKIFYNFVNIFNDNVTIQQYEVLYKFFDLKLSSDHLNEFEWKKLLIPSRSISNNKMMSNPLNIKIENDDFLSSNPRHICSDNERLIFIKLRVKHNPYYLWSSYSQIYKCKTANYLIIERNQCIKLKVSQRKKSKKYRRISTVEIETNNHENNIQNSNHKSTTDLRKLSSDLMDNDHLNESSQYQPYYTFDAIIIKQNGTLTIDVTDYQCNDVGDDDDHSVHRPKGYLHLVIYKDLILEKGAKIDVSGLGYLGGKRYESGDSLNSFGSMDQTANNEGGGGGSKLYELGCAGGGGYGTKGDNGCSGKGFGFGNSKTKYRENIDGKGGGIYGDEQLNVINFGSGGGGGDYGDSKGGNGGGIIIIDCKQNVYMDQMSMMRANGYRGKYESDGCGSGGSVYIKCKQLSMNGTAKIEAIGGKNKTKGNGGNGGDGRIRIKCGNAKSIQWGKYNINPRPFV